MPTINDVRTFKEELKSEFGADATVAYAHVTTTQFSIARHYGGVNISGWYFIYNPEDDSLIREDVEKWLSKKTGKTFVDAAMIEEKE